MESEKTPKAPFIIGAILVILASSLLLIDKIGSASFTTFCGISFVLCLALLGFPRLKELDLKNLKLLLSETKEVKKEIHLKKEDLKKHSLAFTKLVAFTGSMMMRISDRDAYDRRIRFVRKNCDNLLNSLNSSEEEKAEAFRIMNLLEERDKAEEANDQETVTRIDQKIRETIEHEIN